MPKRKKENTPPETTEKKTPPETIRLRKLTSEKLQEMEGCCFNEEDKIEQIVGKLSGRQREIILARMRRGTRKKYEFVLKEESGKGSKKTSPELILLEELRRQVKEGYFCSSNDSKQDSDIGDKKDIDDRENPEPSSFVLDEEAERKIGERAEKIRELIMEREKLSINLKDIESQETGRNPETEEKINNEIYSLWQLIKQENPGIALRMDELVRKRGSQGGKSSRKEKENDEIFYLERIRESVQKLRETEGELPSIEPKKIKDIAEDLKNGKIKIQKELKGGIGQPNTEEEFFELARKIKRKEIKDEVDREFKKIDYRMVYLEEHNGIFPSSVLLRGYRTQIISLIKKTYCFYNNGGKDKFKRSVNEGTHDTIGLDEIVEDIIRKEDEAIEKNTKIIEGGDERELKLPARERNMVGKWAERGIFLPILRELEEEYNHFSFVIEAPRKTDVEQKTDFLVRMGDAYGGRIISLQTTIANREKSEKKKSALKKKFLARKNIFKEYPDEENARTYERLENAIPEPEKKGNSEVPIIFVDLYDFVQEIYKTYKLWKRSHKEGEDLSTNQFYDLYRKAGLDKEKVKARMLEEMMKNTIFQCDDKPDEGLSGLVAKFDRR